MPAETIFWTNTSCLDVERMGEASGRPDRFLGTHGMNPVHLMKGVEVVRHPKLSDDVLDFALTMLKRVNKDPFVTENVPGFIVNNGLIPWMIHYTNMLERRQATTEDIDKALKSSLGHPQGVFLLTDFIGVNTTILVAEELYQATLDPRYIAPPLLYKMREAGWDGFKTGRGFYDWSDRKNPKPIPFEELTNSGKRVKLKSSSRGGRSFALRKILFVFAQLHATGDTGTGFQSVVVFIGWRNCMKIYVGNMSYSTTEDSLRTKFEEFGAVEEVSIVTDRDTGRPRGFGFVTMTSSDEANAAISALNETDLDGRTVKVNEARPRRLRRRRSATSGKSPYGLRQNRSIRRDGADAGARPPS